MFVDPADYQIKVVRGQSWSQTFTCPGFPIDLTAASAVLTVRQSTTGDYEPVIELTDADGIALGEDTFTITFSSAVTDIEAGWYFYDFWVSVGSESYPVFDSKFLVKPSATNV